jgi:hypothetical protein
VYTLCFAFLQGVYALLCFAFITYYKPEVMRGDDKQKMGMLELNFFLLPR